MLYCKNIGRVLPSVSNSLSNLQQVTIQVYNNKFLMFVNKLDGILDMSLQLADIQIDLGHQGNQYLFLRSIWRTHSHLYTNTVVDLDDQLDRLNKIVGMMKKHITYSAKKQLFYQNTTSYDEISIRESRALEAMSKASMEAQQYRSRFIQASSQNEQLKKINSQLRQQIHELKKKRKEDCRKVKQLTEKNASLENKILQSGYEQSKSQTSFLRSSRNFQRQLDNPANMRQSVLNVSISENLITNASSTKSIQKSSLKTSRGRYSNDNSNSKWLNEQSVIQNDLNQSVLSISSYGFLCDQPSMQRIFSQQQNKQNVESCVQGVVFRYESERNLLKQKSLKKNRINVITRDLLGESPKQNIKFIRQKSKKTLLRRSQKLSDSTVLNQPCK